MAKRLRYRDLVKMTIFDLTDDVDLINAVTGGDYTDRKDYEEKTQLRWLKRKIRAEHMLQYAAYTNDLHLESIALKYVLNAEKLTERDKHIEEMRIFRETGIHVIVD